MIYLVYFAWIFGAALAGVGGLKRDIRYTSFAFMCFLIGRLLWNFTAYGGTPS